MSASNTLIDEYVSAHLDQSIAEIKTLCEQPSVSARGEGVRECATLVEHTLQAHGFSTQAFEGYGNPVIVGTAIGKNKNRTLLFYNHYDVQPPEPLELWTSPPYQLTLREGAMYARGVRDDKGEIVSRLAAMDAARAANGGELPCNVTMIVEGEEEIGSPHIAQFVQDHLDLLRCDGAIWEEGGTDGARHRLPLGARGILAIEMSVRTMQRDAHSGAAHVLPSAAWRLVRALNTLKDDDEHVLIDGFYADAKAPSALDVRLMEEQPDQEASLRSESGILTFLRGLRGKDINRAVFTPTCNIQGIYSGYQGDGFKTVIPSLATVKIDFRLVPDQDPQDIFAKLRAHLDRHGFGDVELKWLGAMLPYKAEADDPLVLLADRTAQAVYGAPSMMIPMAGGSSPIYAFARPLKIPVITAGIGNMQNRSHAPDEFVRLEDFVNGTRHVARILCGFGDAQ